MPVFDLKTFAKVSGQGGGLVTSIGTSFGVPSCMLNLSNELLSLLPSNLLGGIRSSVSVGRNAADAVTKALAAKVRQLTGIIEFDTDNGVFRFVSNSSQLGSDNDSFWLNTVAFLESAASFGGSLYSNYQTVQAQIDSLTECLGVFKDYLSYTDGNAASARATLSPLDFEDLVGLTYAVDIQQAQDANTFIVKADNLVTTIDRIVNDRSRNPDLEPRLSESEEEFVEEIFRLEAGPPRSIKGKFILSVDGLYYDSQTEGIYPALVELVTRDSVRAKETDWKLEYDPSLGGRGVPTTVDDLNSYFNTILDPNIVDDSDFLKEYYRQDNLLQNIIGQKNRRVYDVSSNIQEQIDTGGSQVIIDNLKQVMLSEASHFLAKSNKRKKQIELAVKLPNIYGKGQLYEPGSVPVNDFSYLNGINFLMDIEQQRKIVLNQADVRGVVLPIDTKFTQQIESSNPIVLNHLLVANVPIGVTIDSPPTSSAPSIAATEKISEDGLIALYNYLTLKTSSTSSIDFNLHNSSKKGVEYNGQIVGNVSSILDGGLGIVYLDGVCIPNTENTSVIDRPGSYIKLPEKKEFQDLIYNTGGATIETWVYLPSMDSYVSGFNLVGNTSGLYRLILANENTGIGPNTNPQSDILNMAPNGGSETVRGLIYGFTIDRRFTKNLPPSNEALDNPISDMCLVLAQTQSYDNSSVGFINNSDEYCVGNSSWYGMKISTSSVLNNLTLSSCGNEFCQLTLTLDPVNSKISVYLDGSLLSVSAYDAVFPTESRLTASIPSIAVSSSFEYNSTHISTSSSDLVKAGPKLDQYFTPWILGGGYTDGNPNGNFMGGEFGGKVSGLKGYLGCTKFYSRPISEFEVLENYNSARNFFKNISTTDLWEPIISE